MENVRVLVTGAGSGVGQGILKSLRISGLNLTIIIGDINPLNSAMFRGDEAVIIPRVEDPSSLLKMIEVIKSNRIQIVMIGSEFDLEFFSRNKMFIEKETNSLIVASSLNTVLMSNDKLQTADFLKKYNLAHPKSFPASNLAEAKKSAQLMSFPLVLKTRSGTSSRHVYIVKDLSELESLYPSVPNPMLQEMISKPSHNLGCEYTCSVFKTKEGDVLGPLTARRTLRGGSSWMIEVGHFPELHPLLIDIAKNIDFMGSLNIQLMVGEKGPMPFEFNARFSGTTAVRAHFGFNEPAMTIRNYFLGEKIGTPEIKYGMAFRYLEEVFVDGTGANEVTDTSIPKGYVRTWF